MSILDEQSAPMPGHSVAISANPGLISKARAAGFRAAIDADGRMLDSMTMEPGTISDAKAWHAVMARDRSFDGVFVTGVLTTGIYCRPSCPARHPKRENVRFFAHPRAARAAGLRACQRCRPDDMARDASAVRKALAILSRETPPTMPELAASVGYSLAHFQRIFKNLTGVSPGAFARGRRMDRMENILQKAHNVTEAIYEAGYEAPSRFYADSEARLGMTPSAWRNGGQGVRIAWCTVDTTLGRMLVATTDKGICRLSFDEDVAALKKRFPRAVLHEGGPEMGELISNVVAAVERPGSAHAIALDIAGTAFQESVWRELRRIPAGETRTYAQIAAAIGKPGAVRAAGSANGANNVAVLIPCHRVIRSDGTLGGYAYGEDIKRELLKRENNAAKPERR